MEGKTAQRIGRPLIWFTVVAFLFVIAVVFAGPSAAHHVLRFVLHELPFMGQTFTPSAWARGRDWQRCERGSMVRTLMRDHLIIGSTRKPDVVRLLGSAERPVEGNGVTCFRYPIGYCSGFGFDLDYVETCFGADDVLRSRGATRADGAQWTPRSLFLR